MPTPQHRLPPVWQNRAPGVVGHSCLLRMYTVKETECESKEEMLHALIAHSSANKDTVQPIERMLTWEDCKLRMIVDTGSAVCVIPNSIFKKHNKLWPALRKTFLRPSCSLGFLPVFGKLDMEVQLRPAAVSSSLVVVDRQGPLLCGRYTIDAFRKAGVSILEGKTSLARVLQRATGEAVPERRRPTPIL